MQNYLNEYWQVINMFFDFQISRMILLTNNLLRNPRAAIVLWQQTSTQAYERKRKPSLLWLLQITGVIPTRFVRILYQFSGILYSVRVTRHSCDTYQQKKV